MNTLVEVFQSVRLVVLFLRGVLWFLAHVLIFYC